MLSGTQILQNKLSLFTQLKSQDLAALKPLVNGAEAAYPRDSTLVNQGEPRTTSYLLLDGWAAHTKILPDGSRQILSFLMPGDLIGVFAPVAPYATSNVMSLTGLRVIPFASSALLDAIGASPNLGIALAWVAAREEEILAEHLVSLGRRTARERVAHLFLELWVRMRVRGLADGNPLPIPMTQAIIADAMGLSVVHVNRVLRRLASEGVLEVERRTATILDLDRLQRIAGFTEDYLLQSYLPDEMRDKLTRLHP